MSSTTLYRKRNDTTPWPLQCLQDGSAVDLTAQAGVAVFGRPVSASDGSTPKMNDGGTVTVDADPTTGKLVYEPTAAEMDTAGIYSVEVEVAWSDGTITTFPEKGYLRLEVAEDLGPVS